jgi:hypothetical protein
LKRERIFSISLSFLVKLDLASKPFFLRLIQPARRIIEYLALRTVVGNSPDAAIPSPHAGT